MWASGRYFDEGLIGRIQAAVDADPEGSRRALSRQVCEWMDWRSPSGKLRDMACRSSLGDLARKGALRLPQASRARTFGKTGSAVRPRGCVALCLPAVKAKLSDLGAVEIVCVSSGDREISGVWNRLMGDYHYLGAGPLCGAQMRYLVRCERSWCAFSPGGSRGRCVRQRWRGR